MNPADPQNRTVTPEPEHVLGPLGYGQARACARTTWIRPHSTTALISAMLGAMDVTKPYKFIGFGAMDVTKPYKFIGFGAMEVTKPYKFFVRPPGVGGVRTPGPHINVHSS